MKNYDGLRACSRKCIELETECPCTECRLWIDYPDEKNCSLISINENDSMTLREVGERLGISFARVKQIEQKALSRIRKFNIDW
jgi:hypothetical protein|tara:strand:- start:960 stop:1211 length:252 start_codon:yes stop_codon:yes gene_type:complete